MANLPHFVRIAEDGVVEYFLDHTLLSTARMCESRFVLDHVENLRPRGFAPWPLAFGGLIHDCMEFLYKNYKELKPEDFVNFGMKLWNERGFENTYGLTPQFKAIGGSLGFRALLAQYFIYYNTHVHYLRPVALEIPFGKGKEVPLLEDHKLYKFAPFRLYLSGRMDYIFDNGKQIGPLDHKTFSTDGKNPSITYEVQEGMTGYAYAMKYIFERLKAEWQKENPSLVYERDTNIVWMNYILTKSEPDMNKRFQRIPLYKTPEQLEDFRLRQISTASKIHQILFEGREPDWNTQVCTNYWHRTCHYQAVHRLPSRREQQLILDKTFTIVEPWNPEKENLNGE